MSSDDVAIRIDCLSKCYEIYDVPRDRLKQFVLPRMKRALGRPSTNYYREFWAVRNVSLDIRRGETVGIIGRNGSGKSTLLQMVCGTLNPTAGNIQVNGRIAALLELGSGFSPEFTGRENVYLSASVLGLSTAEIDARFDEIAAFADIGDFIEQPVKTYSSGMMVRLAFSVIAHVDAAILIVDEALAVGDAFFTQKCMRFFRDFIERGTLLFVSHDTGSIKSLCNRAVWMDHGQIMREGSPKEVCESYLEAFYESSNAGGRVSPKAAGRAEVGAASLPLRDQRLDFVNASNLRNDLQVFKFDPGAASFGDGSARIVDVRLLDEHERPLAWVVGGETVTLYIRIEASIALHSPIVGFLVKDRLGQTLFGDNSYLTYLDEPMRCEEGDFFGARFQFDMPVMPHGDYTIAVAVASGTQQEHVQHHWIHDAVLFKSESSSLATGLVGIPMRSIELKVEVL
ncbi:ABC transporter ATP-binding protein [Pseudorhodoferax sp.]|uniref:ABC transporter ATP-binding protein n=1 Tax=Pseudorhodoferax sp. TaxID=1993553 RepID=UPI0039E45501